MPAATSSPLKRRVVKYRGYEMIVEDAERIAAGSYETVGQWSFAQILDHLTKSFAASIDGIDTQLPLPMRLFGRLLLKGRMLNKTLPAGFKFPDGSNSAFAPDETVDVDSALAAFRDVVHRCKSTKQRGRHPLFGKLDTPEWDRFNLRHAELHMSFVVPTNDESDPSTETEATAPVTSNA